MKKLTFLLSLGRWLSFHIFLCLFSAFIAPAVSAQTLHAILVADISPAAGWGKYKMAVAMDMTVVEAMLNFNMPERQLNIVRLELEENSDSDPNKLLAAIRVLPVKPKDTVLFYYSGHGGADDRGQYFELAKGKLYRQQVVETMEAKQGRLVVILSDCCNTRSDGYLYAAPYIPFENPQTPTPLFRSLFIDPEGRVDINSCAPGESAFFTPLKEDGPPPLSIFTAELTEWAEQNRSRPSSWDKLISAVGLRVQAEFEQHYPKGASIAKGGVVQNRQTVFPFDYPGKPEAKGPRSGFKIRDFSGRGAVVIEVAAGSPASQVYHIDQKKFVSIQTQQVIVSVNGKETPDTKSVSDAIAASPQISKLGIRDAKGGTYQVLIRLRY